MNRCNKCNQLRKLNSENICKDCYNKIYYKMISDDLLHEAELFFQVNVKRFLPCNIYTLKNKLLNKFTSQQLTRNLIFIKKKSKKFNLRYSKKFKVWRLK